MLAGHPGRPAGGADGVEDVDSREAAPGGREAVDSFFVEGATSLRRFGRDGASGADSPVAAGVDTAGATGGTGIAGAAAAGAVAAGAAIATSPG